MSRRCAHALDEKQADRILLLHVRELTTICDYFLIATGRNARHLKALARELEGIVDRAGREIYGEEGTAESGWILLDLGEVVVHLFDPERREIYNLELLWGDAERLEWSEVSSGPG
ncbi:MAG: ribosome silencing factor [Planctomycetes bacterium]|nr:ribosome silencing factor [Planctomycetota bacterium]